MATTPTVSLVVCPKALAGAGPGDMGVAIAIFGKPVRLDAKLIGMD
jgi:hypothetical protein